MRKVTAKRGGGGCIEITATTTQALSAEDLELRKGQLRNQIIGITAQIAQLTEIRELAEAELAAIEDAEAKA